MSVSSDIHFVRSFLNPISIACTSIHIDQSVIRSRQCYKADFLLQTSRAAKQMNSSFAL